MVKNMPQRLNVESARQMASSWRQNYEREIRERDNGWIIEEMQEEIETYIGSIAYRYLQSEAITKQEYQEIINAAYLQLDILKEHIRQVEEELAGVP